MKKLLAIAAAVFLCRPLDAAISRIQHVNGTTTATVSATGTGNVIVAYCISNGVGCSPTDNATAGSNTYSEVIGARALFEGFSMTAWVVSSSKSGATTVTAGGNGAFLNVFEYSGAKTTSPVDVSTGTNLGNCLGHSCSGNSMTTTNAGSVLTSYILANDVCGSVFAPWGNWAGASGISSADYLPGSIVTSSATFNCTTNNDTFGTSSVAILPAPSASSFGTINNPVVGGF